jgi:hypothetical protein
MKTWQIHLGIWGSILWMASFQIFEYFNNQGQQEISRAISGYTIGFVTAFVGYLFWEITHGKWEVVFGDDRGISKALSAFSFFVLFLIGAFGFLNSIFNTLPWFYNITFALAGIVVAQGLIPLIKNLEGK